MKKPIQCNTPSRNQMAYKLTATDIRNLTKLINEANNILAYYINMPENKTGELFASDGSRFDTLCEAIEDLQTTIGDINLSEV